MRDDKGSENDEDEGDCKGRDAPCYQRDVRCALRSGDEARREQKEYPHAGALDGSAAPEDKGFDEDVEKGRDGGEGPRKED